MVCDSYVRPATLVRICDECNYGSYAGRCVICGGVGISDAYYCKECTVQEKDVSPRWPFYLLTCCMLHGRTVVAMPIAVMHALCSLQDVSSPQPGALQCWDTHCQIRVVTDGLCFCRAAGRLPEDHQPGALLSCTVMLLHADIAEIRASHAAASMLCC